MTRDRDEPIVETAACGLPFPIICVHHHRYPEVRGEGRSFGEALRQLRRLLARGLDHTHGPKRVALERALAEVRAFPTPGPRPRRPPAALTP